jgi:(2R)-3-sulfolactate dehydrogenase (NADP+)
VDGAGRPTTDANAALKGTMLPMGDAKGSALVLMVEILAATLTGANYGYEASSFFEGEGKPPHVGQMMIAIDPAASVDVFTGNGFAARLETLISQIRMQPGTHIPGSRREEKRREARHTGVKISADLHNQLTALAGG